MPTPSRRPLAAARRAGVLTLLLAAPAAPAALHAQQSANADTLRAGRDTVPAARTLRRVEIVGRRAGYAADRAVSATRTTTPLRDVPQSVAVVTSEVIADRVMTTLADVAPLLPGVVMGQGEGHRDAPTIRGTSTTADMFVDGVRDDVEYIRDLYNVDRVEALKGANALAFGRGGGGGVLNRVTKTAGWTPVRGFTLGAGAYDYKRASVDAGGAVAGPVALRVNGVLESSGHFRDAVRLRRYGVSPTATLVAGPRTLVRLDAELFDDERTVDRGIPSFGGRPSAADRGAFFGDPTANRAEARVLAAGATVEHLLRPNLTLRNRTRVADYAKSYQNVVPGAVSADASTVTLSAYSNATDRTNLFTQTDLVLEAATGRVAHTLLAGAELGRQATENFRQTGFFGEERALAVPFASPRPTVAVAFRQGETDADNTVTATVGAVYVQDQLQLGPWQATLGARVERFDLDFANDRTGERLSRADVLVSPRAGLVFKPATPVSLYASYGTSFLPSAGDQFASLTATSRTLEPERFDNYEVGAKWDVRGLALTAAAFRLDRTNTTARDPNDPTRLVQTGEQRTTGWEVGAAGRVLPGWDVVAAFAAQDAEVRSATTAAPAGARAPLVPRRTASLWNRVQVLPRLGLGLGVVHRTDMFAAIDNTVTLPGYTRLDGAAYVTVAPGVRAQVNVENLLDRTYYATSHGNNGIQPGAPRLLRLSLATDF